MRRVVVFIVETFIVPPLEWINNNFLKEKCIKHNTPMEEWGLSGGRMKYYCDACIDEWKEQSKKKRRKK